MIQISVICNKSIRQILEKIIGCCYKNKARCCKNCSQTALHKRTEVTGKSTGNKIAEKIERSKSVPVPVPCNYSTREKDKHY